MIQAISSSYSPSETVLYTGVVLLAVGTIFYTIFRNCEIAQDAADNNPEEAILNRIFKDFPKEQWSVEIQKEIERLGGKGKNLVAKNLSDISGLYVT